MQVRKRCAINVAFSALTALIVILALVWGVARINRATKESEITNEILNNLYQRILLRSDYVRGDQNAKAEWFSKNNRIGELLKSADEIFRLPDEKRIVAQMVKDRELAEKIFLLIVQNRESSETAGGLPERNRIVENRLVRQMNGLVQTQLIHGSQLRDYAAARMLSILSLTGWTILGIVSIVTAGSIVNSIRMSRIIGKRVGRLHEGARVIGEGNLDVRISIEGDDEFSDLAAGINDMSEKLEHTYWKLEDEIRGHERAERTLKENEQKLELFIENAPADIVMLDREMRYIFASRRWRTDFRVADRSITGLSHYELFPDLPGHWKDAYKRCLSGETIKTDEEEFLRKDGSTGWIRWEAHPWFTGSGFVGGIIIMSEDITERKHAEETIRYQAYHDSLTGLPNRAMFTEIANREIPQMIRVQRKLAVLILDIDRFKNINDSLGHQAGEALIQSVAVRLKASLGETDALARIGGDKFAILLSFLTSPEQASRTAEKIIEDIQKPFQVSRHELSITASIGICLYPEDGMNAEELFKNAEIAMYHAKDQGRNRYQFFNPSQNIRTLELVLFENKLRRAIDLGELTVYYQPQANIKTRKIIGAEALVRWRHPERGLLGPSQFIPLAEEIGLVVKIDHWVLHTVCAQLKSWQLSGYSPPSVAINLSALQFQRRDLDQIISRALTETGIGPELLKVEITETIAMQDTELTYRNLSRMNAMGIAFSIDDFGTGYSSLSYLRKLPIHKLKIDKSFISNLMQEPDDQTITQAVIAMAHSLKLEVVAEGVETEEQLAFVRAAGCDEAQGFLFGEPATAQQFAELIAAGK